MQLPPRRLVRTHPHRHDLSCPPLTRFCMHAAKENAPIATEQAATTTSVPEAEVVPAAATTESEAPAAPVAEAPVHHEEDAHKKPKSPGVFEK